MGNDREFRIKIATTADNSGIQSATTAMGDGAKAAKLFAGEGMELRKAISELSLQFPIAGEALRILTDPVAGGIAVGILAFTYFKTAINEMNAATDEMTKKNADPAFLESINAKKEALESAALAYQHFIYEADHATSSEAAYQETIKRGMALIEDSAKAKESAGDALFGLDEAELKAQYDAGLLLYDDFQLKLAAREIKRRHDKEAAQEAEINAQIHTLVGAADTAYFQKQNDPAKVNAATDASTAAANRVAKDKADLDMLLKDRAEQDARRDAADVQKTFLGFGVYNYDFKTGMNVPVRSDQAGYDQAIAAGESDTKKIFAIQHRMPGDQSAAQDAEDALGTAKSDAKDHATALKENTAAVQALIDKLNTMQGSAAGTMGAEDATTLLKTHAGQQAYIADKIAGTIGDLFNHLLRKVENVASAQSSIVNNNGTF